MKPTIEKRQVLTNYESNLTNILLRIGIELYKNSKQQIKTLDGVTLVQTYGEDWDNTIKDIWSIEFVKVKEKLKDIEIAFEETYKQLLQIWLNTEGKEIEVNNLFDVFSWEEGGDLLKEIWTFFQRNNSDIRKKLSDLFNLYYSDLPKKEKTAEYRYSFEYDLPENLISKFKDILGAPVFDTTFWEEKDVLNKLSEGCSYDYLSPLTNANLFERTTGIKIKELIKNKESILLVWSWSGKTVEFLIGQGVPAEQITCVDISQEAIDYTTSLWCTWYVWRIEDCPLDGAWYDYCLLEYFVDRDDNQMATFDEASSLARKKVVIEWLFPVVSEDTSWTSYVTNKDTLVTQWNSASDDMQRVANYLENNMWISSNITYSLGMRLVSTLWDGVEVLPSGVISISK